MELTLLALNSRTIFVNRSIGFSISLLRYRGTDTISDKQGYGVFPSARFAKSRVPIS